MARMLHESRPVAYYGWTGVGQHTNATQTDRAIALVCALTGSFDAPGGNVIFARVPVNDVRGAELMAPAQRAKTIGMEKRPIGPPRGGWVTGGDLYDAILEGRPYPVRGLVGFGANLLVAHADGARGREALRRLDFFVHADLYMTPTAELADIVLPVASAWEREGLRVGFEVSQAAEGTVQLRPPVVAPQGEARSDNWIVFELAKRLGLGNAFWQGDIEAGYRYLLAPSGIGLEALRQSPAGIRIALETRFRKYAGDGKGGATGFQTPTRKVEVYSELFLAHGQAPLPEFVEPAVGPRAAPISQPASRSCSPPPRRRSSATASTATCRGCAGTCRTRRSSFTPRRRRRAASAKATGSGSRRRMDGCGRARGSRRASMRASSRPSTAGGRPAPSSAFPAMRRLGRRVPTTTPRSTRMPSIRSAAPPATAPSSARSPRPERDGARKHYSANSRATFIAALAGTRMCCGSMRADLTPPRRSAAAACASEVVRKPSNAM